MVEEEEEEEKEENDGNEDVNAPSCYFDASSTTPSKMLNFILSGDASSESPGDPFKSPVSVARGEGRSTERRTREAWLMRDPRD